VLNQDVTLTGGILKSKELHTSNEMLQEIYATTLVDAKVRAGGSTFMGVQNKSIKKHFWRDYQKIMYYINFNGKRYFSSLGNFLKFYDWSCFFILLETSILKGFRAAIVLIWVFLGDIVFIRLHILGVIG
jgi:hypothetical protein